MSEPARDHAPVCMRQYLPHLVTARLRRTAHGGVWAPMGNLDVKFLCSPKYKGFGHINTLVFALRPYLNRALFIPRAPTSSPQTSSTIMKLALAVASFFGLTLTLVRGGGSKLAYLASSPHHSNATSSLSQRHPGPLKRLPVKQHYEHHRHHIPDL